MIALLSGPSTDKGVALADDSDAAAAEQTEENTVIKKAARRTAKSK